MTFEYFRIKPLETGKNEHLSYLIACLLSHIYYLDTKAHFCLLSMRLCLLRYSQNHRGKSTDALFLLVMLARIRLLVELSE